MVFRFEDCSFNEATQNLTCLLPDLQLGADFIRKLQQDQESGVNTSTTQNGSVAKLNGPNETVAFVYLGLVFDGYRKYDNVSDPKSGLKDPLYLGFIPPPTINSSTDVLTFDPKTDDVIVIKVWCILKLVLAYHLASFCFHDFIFTFISPLVLSLPTFALTFSFTVSLPSDFTF